MKSSDRKRLEENLSKYELVEVEKDNKKKDKRSIDYDDFYLKSMESLLDVPIDMGIDEEFLRLSLEDSVLYDNLLESLTEKTKLTNLRMSPLDTLILKTHLHKKYRLSLSSGIRQILWGFMARETLSTDKYTIMKLDIYDEVKELFFDEYKKNPDKWEKYHHLFDGE